jgi:hypothetical protein
LLPRNGNRGKVKNQGGETLHATSTAPEGARLFIAHGILQNADMKSV